MIVTHIYLLHFYLICKILGTYGRQKDLISFSLISLTYLMIMKSIFLAPLEKLIFFIYAQIDNNVILAAFHTHKKIVIIISSNIMERFPVVCVLLKRLDFHV